VNIVTAIMTAPRPRPTLARSLMSYRDAGFTNHVHIFSDGGTEALRDINVSMFHNEPRLGNFRNWVQAMSVILKIPADWYMICEDDITWSTAAAIVLEKDLSRFTLDNTCGAISLYCPERMSKVLERDYANGKRLRHGYYGANLGRKTWGAQCLLFHRMHAVELMQHTAFIEWFKDMRNDKNVDAWVAKSIEERGREILYRIPCLVDHDMGDNNSSIYGEKVRPDLRTSYFAGRG
jgi:hypothetical protein